MCTGGRLCASVGDSMQQRDGLDLSLWAHCLAAPLHTLHTSPHSPPTHPLLHPGGTDTTGTAQGLSRVLYTAGTCRVDPVSPFDLLQPLVGPCREVRGDRLLKPAAPAFVCGRRVSGKSLCGGGWGLV